MKKLSNTITKCAAAFIFCATTPALASPWTSVGSAGTVDEADTGEISLTDGILTFGASAPAAATIVARYNIVATPDLDNGGVNKVMGARFLDNGANANVVLLLRKYNFSTGVTTTLLTLNSNSFASSGSYQTQSVGDSCTGERFDFYQNAYYIEATISRTTAAGTAGVAIMRVEDIDIC